MTAIILASGSAIRLELLQRAGIAVRAVPHGVDERAIEAERQASGRDLARRLAFAKALSASRREPDAYVIAADQTLEFGGKVFSKPADRSGAKEQLRRLSGQRHSLHSSYAVARGGPILARGTRTARLTMRPLDDMTIDAYLDRAGDAATKSVGAYQIEGFGIQLFDRIDGDYFTILGLPMLPLMAALRRLGALPQ